MLKIPRNTKAANVLIGEVDYLKEEIAVLVRLTNPFVLGRFTEVTILTKYVFLYLGPKGNMIKYDEIGKCISTLFSDEV